MRRNRKALIYYSFALVFSFIGLSLSSASITEGSNNDPNILYNVVIEGIVKNCQKIKCGTLIWERKQMGSDGEAEKNVQGQEGIFQMWWDSKKMASKSTTWHTSENSKTGERLKERSTIKVYDGNEYRGMIVDAQNITLAKLPRFGQLDNYFENCFGLPGFAKKSIIDKLSEDINDKEINLEWSIDKSDSAKKIKLKRSKQESGNTYTDIYYFDPAKSCMLVQREFYTNDELRGSCIWSLEEVTQGVWFPVGINNQGQIWISDDEVMKYTVTFSVDLKKSSFNDHSAIPKGVFELEITPDIQRITDYRFGDPPKIYRGDEVAEFLRQNRQAWSLLVNVGATLPEFDGIKIDIDKEQIRNKKILVCFFDMEQRPSRNCILQLSKRAQEQSAKDVVIIAVQASKIERAKLDEWIKESEITFPVGIIEGDSEKVQFAWGVKSLPWLILTDIKHVVIAEGFSIDELDEKIKGLGKK